MKGILEFDLEDEVDAEKHRCAQKGYQMSGMIDSFLDYLFVMRPVLIKMESEKMYEKIYATYLDKMIQSEVVDMLESDLRHLVEHG